MSYFTQRTI